MTPDTRSPIPTIKQSWTDQRLAEIRRETDAALRPPADCDLAPAPAPFPGLIAVALGFVVLAIVAAWWG